MTASGRELRVLLLAYYFPPDGGPGAQRPIAFVRHLPGFGIRCTVLTRAVPAGRGCFDPADPAGVARVADRCHIVRAAATGVASVADRGEWVRAGIAAATSERPDVVLATMSPFELWRVAVALGDRLHVPVVLDLRDPWALDGVQTWRTRWHWLAARREMRTALARAEGVIANTAECQRLFGELAPGLQRSDTIPNGWDLDDFAPPAPVVEPGAALTLLHAGTFLCSELYPPTGWRRLPRVFHHRAEPIDPSGRTPLHLLEALRVLRAQHDAAGRDVRFVTIGQVDGALTRCVAESGASAACDVLPYMPHGELVQRMRRADALFLTLHGLPAGARSRIVPGKTYEYLASGRPILAALPPGDARDLVARSPRAFVAEPTSPRSIATQLQALHRAWRAGAFREAAPPAGIERFERRRLAGELAAFLREVVGGDLGAFERAGGNGVGLRPRLARS